MKEYIIKVDESKKDIMGGMPLVEQAKELIRCCDCLHKNYCSIHDAKYLDDWFCADGERK